MTSKRSISYLCSWCGKHFKGPKPGAASEISHGICEKCRDEVLRRLGLDPAEFKKNPATWWYRQAHPPRPSRKNPAPILQTKVFEEVDRVIDQAMKKATMESSLSFLAKKAVELWIRHTLPEKRRALQHAGKLRQLLERARRAIPPEKTPQTRTRRTRPEPSTYQRHLRDFLASRNEKEIFEAYLELRTLIWKAFGKVQAFAPVLAGEGRTEVFPSVPFLIGTIPDPRLDVGKEAPVFYLVDLATALERAMRGTGPVPEPWTERILFDAHLFVEQLPYRYKTAAGAVKGLRKKAESMAAGTRTKLPNRPGAAYLEKQAQLLEGKIRLDPKYQMSPAGKPKLPDTMKAAVHRKSEVHQLELDLAAQREDLVARALFLITTDEAVRNYASRIAVRLPNDPTKYKMPSSPGPFGSWSTVGVGSGYELTSIVTSLPGLHPRARFYLRKSKRGKEEEKFWILDEHLRVLSRAEKGWSQAHDGPFKKRDEDLARKVLEQSKAVVTILRLGIANFFEAAARWKYRGMPAKGYMLDVGPADLRPFDPEKDVRIIWKGDTPEDKYQRVVLVEPVFGPTFFVQLEHRPGSVTHVHGKKPGGYVDVHFPKPAPPPLIRKGFLEVMALEDLQGPAPAVWKIVSKPILPAAKYEAIVGAAEKKLEQGFKTAVAAMGPAPARTRKNPLDTSSRWHMKDGWLVRIVTTRPKGSFAKKAYQTKVTGSGAHLLFGCPTALWRKTPSGKSRRCYPAKKRVAAAKKAGRTPPKSGREPVLVKRKLRGRRLADKVREYARKTDFLDLLDAIVGAARYGGNRRSYAKGDPLTGKPREIALRELQLRPEMSDWSKLMKACPHLLELVKPLAYKDVVAKKKTWRAVLKTARPGEMLVAYSILDDFAAVMQHRKGFAGRMKLVHWRLGELATVLVNYMQWRTRDSAGTLTTTPKFKIPKLKLPEGPWMQPDPELLRGKRKKPSRKKKPAAEKDFIEETCKPGAPCMAEMPESWDELAQKWPEFANEDIDAAPEVVRTLVKAALGDAWFTDTLKSATETELRDALREISRSDQVRKQEGNARRAQLLQEELRRRQDIRSGAMKQMRDERTPWDKHAYLDLVEQAKAKIGRNTATVRERLMDANLGFSKVFGNLEDVSDEELRAARENPASGGQPWLKGDVIRILSHPDTAAFRTFVIHSYPEDLAAAVGEALRLEEAGQIKLPKHWERSMKILEERFAKSGIKSTPAQDAAVARALTDPGYWERNPGPRGGTTKVQTILFSKKKWTPRSARKWLKAHGFKAPRVDKGSAKASYYRFRQATPKKGARKRTLVFSKTKGIKAVVEISTTRSNPGTELLVLTNPGKKPSDREWYVEQWFAGTWHVKKAGFPSKQAAEDWLDDLEWERRRAGFTGPSPHTRIRSRSRRPNPPGEGQVSEKAMQAYRGFHGARPAKIIKKEGTPPAPPTELISLGELVDIGYRVPDHSRKRGLPFRHRFGETKKGMLKNPRLPQLATDPEGKQLYIVGGGYRVRPEGIIA